MGTGRKLTLQKEVELSSACSVALWLLQGLTVNTVICCATMSQLTGWQHLKPFQQDHTVLQDVAKIKAAVVPTVCPLSHHSYWFPSPLLRCHWCPRSYSVIQSKTNPETQRDYFSSGSVPQVKSTGQSQEQQWRRRDGTDNMWWGTQQDCSCPVLQQLKMPQSFTCRLQQKSLSRNLSFKSLATLGHSTS